LEVQITKILKYLKRPIAEEKSQQKSRSRGDDSNYLAINIITRSRITAAKHDKIVTGSSKESGKDR
jgi:hypothetical protein